MGDVAPPWLYDELMVRTRSEPPSTCPSLASHTHDRPLGRAGKSAKKKDNASSKVDAAKPKIGTVIVGSTNAYAFEHLRPMNIGMLAPPTPTPTPHSCPAS